MIQRKTIICFASGWDYHPTSKHHVMRMLAKGNNIIWVNWHASRRPGFGWSDLRSISGRLWQMRRGARQVADSISVLTPRLLPLPGSALARRWNAWTVRRAVRQALADLPDRPVQVWSFAPDVSDLAGAFDEELVLYYCVDAFGEFPGYDRSLIERRERDLLQRSDVVITTSPPLYDAKRRSHPNVHLVQHGVDHGRLSRAAGRDLPVPRELRHLRRPLIGFVGIIGEWVDLNLISGLARRRPDASFVLIGPEAVSRGPCGGLGNVHWLGPKDHEMLPNYLQCFDAGLIPFKHVPLTYHANPIKLYEYLAAGVPVVSTSLPAVKAIPRSVWLADDVEAADASCAAALLCNGEADRRDRSRQMISESWTARLEQISKVVDETLRGRTVVVDAARREADPSRAAMQSA